MKYIGLLVGLTIAALASVTRAGAVDVKLDLKDGDRVAFIGNTFVEREQKDCYIETMLTSRFPDRNITFRNLGYSADTVTGSARGLCAGWSTFEGSDKAFERLRKLVAEFKPTVLLMNYGMTESFSGPEGLPQFTANYNKMLDALSTAAGTSPRIVLMSPNYHEDLGRPLPDPTEHNKNLELYSNAIASLGEKRASIFINLFHLTSASSSSPLTSNGIHLTGYGYWSAAEKIASDLDYRSPMWKVSTNVVTQTATAEGAKGISLRASSPTAVRFEISDAVLPPPPLPSDSPKAILATGNGYSQLRVVQVIGLAQNTYELKAGDQVLAKATAGDWAKGVEFRGGPDVAQAEALRQLIVAKNFDFFNYQRPDNDAYILAFRRGEQGRNAVEIPRFLPLVEEKEKQIAELRVPKPVTYTLEAVK